MSGQTDMLRQSRSLVKQADAPPFSVFDKPVSMRALDDFIRLADAEGGLANNSSPFIWGGISD